MAQVPVHDVILTFADKHSEFEMRVASRNGHETGPEIVRRLTPLLDDGWKVTYTVVPSRFAS